MEKTGSDDGHVEETTPLGLDEELLAASEGETVTFDLDGASRGIAAPLEGEERCHAFFCASSEDDQWVNDLVSKLQSPAYGFKCDNVLHEHDPGTLRMDKIVNALSTSKKIVLILSPDFMSSPWCSYDHLRTLRPYLTNRAKVLVVTVSEVDLPEFLDGFPTIDSTSATFWQTFVGSLQISFSSVDGSPRSSRSKEVLVNGLELGQASSMSRCCCGAHFDTVYCPAGLARKGIVIPQNEFTTAVTTILESSKMRWYSVWYNWYLHMAASIMLTVLVTCGVVFNLTKSDVSVFLALVVAWIISTIATVLIHLIAYYKRRQLSFHVESYIARANMIVSQHHILIGMTDRFRGVCFKAVLHFLYYDLEKCKESMKDFLQQHRDTGGSKASSINIDVAGVVDDTSRLTASNKMTLPTLVADTDPSSLDEEAELFLLQSSPSYAKLLVKRKLPKAMSRHCRGVICLCQFVQWRIFHEPL